MVLTSVVAKSVCEASFRMALPQPFPRAFGLMLTETVDLIQLKQTWLAALDEAESFVNTRPITEVGCLY